MKTLKINGARLRELREANHWTQETLAEKAIVASRTVQRAERGEPLDPTRLAKIANALHIDVAELVVKEEPKTHELLFLPRVTTSSALQQMAGCHARLEMHDEPADAREREAIGALLDTLEDFNMIWDDLSPSGRLNAGESLLGVVRELDAIGLRLFSTVAEKDVEVPGGAPMRWKVAHIVITKRDNPSVLSKPESPEEMAVFATFPIKPKLGMQ